MKKSRRERKIVLGVGIMCLFLIGNLGKSVSIPPAQDVTDPESRVLDLAAEALGWTERTNDGSSIVHNKTSGDVSVHSRIKWATYPESYYYYAGNLPGISFGETGGYQGGSGCSIAGGCNPPTKTEYFQFNFDMNYDGDNNIDTPAGSYLGYFCEVTVAAPEGQLYVPREDADHLCSVVLEKALAVRASLQVPACMGVACPYSMCNGNTRLFDGHCDPATGECKFESSQNCGTPGCNPGTGKCNQPESDLCSGVTCEPSVCIDNVSYSDPACDPDDGTCNYFTSEDCGSAGCNSSTGQCNQPEAGLCLGVTCEPSICIDNVSYSNPACDPADGTCGYYTSDDCGSTGCNQDTGQCNSSSPICGGSMVLLLAPVMLMVKRFKPSNSLKMSHSP